MKGRMLLIVRKKLHPCQLFPDLLGISLTSVAQAFQVNDILF